MNTELMMLHSYWAYRARHSMGQEQEMCTEIAASLEWLISPFKEE